MPGAEGLLIKELLRTTGAYGGTGAALILAGIVWGILRTQRRCKEQKEICDEERRHCMDELEKKINGSVSAAKGSIDHHQAACPNTKQLAKLSARYETEIKNIHYRITEIKEASEFVKRTVSEELREQRKFLNELSVKIVNGLRQGSR